MSDPPRTETNEATFPQASVDEVPLELVKEGYIRVTEIFYNWATYLDPWQANAVKALTNPGSLAHPDHPLCLKGEEGLKLFNCIKSEGYELLCFSLKQVEYLQYYIHEMRLADPEWTNYLAKLSSANAADQPAKGEEVRPPPYVEEGNPWVPLPSAVIRASEFEEVETVHFTEAKSVRQYINAQRKHNNTIDKQLNKMQHMSPEDRARAEAEIDNSTPGPGLRRGPPRRYERKEREEERPEGTGWGGFPLKDPSDKQEVIPIADHEPTEWKEEETGRANSVASESGDQDKEVDPQAGLGEVKRDEAALSEQKSSLTTHTGPTMQPEKASLHVSDDPEIQPDTLAEQMNKLNTLRAKLDAEDATDEDMKEKADDPIEKYYFDAQQAMLLASAGGLANALRGQEKDVKAEKEDGGEQEDAQIPPGIGRSLFFALRLTTWEEDENVVLEVGWAATWWQEKLDIGGKKEKLEDEAVVDSRFERITEQGHIIVQDHLLGKRNGTTKPDNRMTYNFGTSIPLPAGEVNRTIKQKMQDLAKRAGGGPIYLLIHSSDGAELEYKKLGWKTGGWEKEIRPKGWEYPSYASPEGVGKVFLIDTARLFGTIENDQSILPALGKTRKSLEEVARTMFGQDEAMAPKACGNAGNDASYCLQMFMSIVNGLPLEILRADYQQSLEPITIEPPSRPVPEHVNDPPNGHDSKEATQAPQISANEEDFTTAMRLKAESKVDSAPAVTSAPVTPPAPGQAATPQIGSKEEEEEESDDEEGIKGVYWEDRDGKMVELE